MMLGTHRIATADQYLFQALLCQGQQLCAGRHRIIGGAGNPDADCHADLLATDRDLPRCQTFTYPFTEARPLSEIDAVRDDRQPLLAQKTELIAWVDLFGKRTGDARSQ